MKKIKRLGGHFLFAFLVLMFAGFYIQESELNYSSDKSYALTSKRAIKARIIREAKKIPRIMRSGIIWLNIEKFIYHFLFDCLRRISASFALT